MPSDAVGVSISPSLSIYLSLSIFLSPSIYLSLSIYLSIYLSIHPAIYPSISPSTYLSIQLSIYLSVYLSLSISLPIYPSIHPSIYLSLSLSLQDPPNRGGRRHPGASPFYILTSFNTIHVWWLSFLKSHSGPGSSETSRPQQRSTSRSHHSGSVAMDPESVTKFSSRGQISWPR